MATAAQIGGVGAGLQALMKAGAPLRQARTLEGAGQRSFAAQFQAIDGGAEKLSAKSAAMPTGEAQGSPVDASVPSVAKALPADGKSSNLIASLRVAIAVRVQDTVPAVGRTMVPPSGGVVSKNGVAKKATTEASSAKPSAVDEKTLAIPQVPPAVAAAVHGPVTIAAVAVAVEGTKVGLAPSGTGKVVAGRGREAKASTVAEHTGRAVVGDGRPSADVQAAVVQVRVAAASTAPTSVVATDGTAVGAVLAAPEAAAAGAGGIAKIGESEHRPAGVAGHEFHGEMDGASGAAIGETRTLVSTPHVLEVGITGGAHGWLRVRAELGHTGEVTASLVASSAASADALHKELGAMSAYLKSEVVGVSSLAVTAMEKGGATAGFGAQGSAGGTAAGTGSGESSRQSGGGDRKQSSWTGFRAGYASQVVPGALLGTGVGGWLNVRV